MSAHPEIAVAHGMFTLERRYDASPERVYRAYADPAAFRRWFVEGEGWTIHEWVHDFRVGGIADYIIGNLSLLVQWHLRIFSPQQLRFVPVPAAHPAPEGFA